MSRRRAGTSAGSTASTLAARLSSPRRGYKEKLRFNWNTPIALSPNEKGTIYIGSQFLFRSRDHGTTWDRISPDLIDQRSGAPAAGAIGRHHRRQFGGRNATRRSIRSRKARKAAGQIWVGTDDGNVQLTRDGGKNWTNVTRTSECRRATGSAGSRRAATIPAVAYVTVDRHANGDLAPYLYRTARLRPDLEAADRPERPACAAMPMCEGRPAQPEHPVRRHRIRAVMSLDAGAAGRSSSRTISPTASRCATSRCRSAKTISCSRRMAAASG